MKKVSLIAILLLTGLRPELHAGNGNTPVNPQHVLIQDFHAQVMQDEVRLEWTSLNEINSWHYVLERSCDGIHFEQLTEMPAAGNSTTTLHYTFTDKNPQAGCNYYRLLDRDHNGVNDQLCLTTASFKACKKADVFPNPVSFGQPVHFSPAADVTQIEIHDFSGNLIAIIPMAGSDLPEVQEGHILKPGGYIVKMISPSASTSTLLMVL